MNFQLKYKGEKIDELLDKADTALQEHQPLDHLATKEEVKAVADKVESIKPYDDTMVYERIAEVEHSIPTKVGQLENDKGYLTDHQSLDGYATESYVNGKVDSISIPSLEGYATEQWVREQDYLTEHQNIDHLATKAELDNKVDKVDGKQLSTEDFTTILKSKLEALKNYDDAELVSRIDTIEAMIDTLFGKDASSAIESFNEIIAFLEGIEDSENLDSIIASIEQQIADVAIAIPTKVSELDNDEGYLTEHQDVSGKLDKTEAISTYLTKADAQTTYLGINGKAKSAEWADKATQATKAVQDAAGRNLTVTYATKAELDKKQNTIANLDAISSGAALGATALQSVPSEYSPTLDVLKLVYPVGAIYVSTIETSPKTLFGFGTWERIKDTFLLGAGDSYSAGSTGGEAEHTLTTDEMPSHKHTATTAEAGGHTHTIGNDQDVTYNASGKCRSVHKAETGASYYDGSTGESGAHTHTMTVENTGGGDAHNNMPPYLAVYIWKRTE